MNKTEIIFKLATQSEEFEQIYNYNVDVFADSPDFNWSVDALKKESAEGWRVYSVLVNDEVIAAAFLKKDQDKLLTKNTPIKMLYQGNGYSHIIKDFFEQEAKKLHVRKVVNICPSDNFRMISLNETHGYKKTGNQLGENKSLIEWIKDLKGE